MFKQMFQKAKQIFAKIKSQETTVSNRRMQTPQELQHAAQINNAVKTSKVERFFYRNAGLNRTERNRLAGTLRKGKAKMSKQQRDLVKMVLRESPKNIPYVAGQKIHPRHVGSATPKHLIAGAE